MKAVAASLMSPGTRRVNHGIGSADCGEGAMVSRCGNDSTRGEAAPTTEASGAATETKRVTTADPAQVFPPGGMSLADWALLAEERLGTGDHARLLAEADAHLREHGQYSLVEDVRDRAIAGLVASVSVATKADPRIGLRRIEGIVANDRVLAQQLIERGADPNATDARSGNTPLHHAAGNGSFRGHKTADHPRRRCQREERRR